MVEHVTNRTVFHLTESKPYKQAFVAGQKYQVGESYTPYFGFYEGVRAYPLTLGDGNVIQVPAVQFIKGVKRGEINCPELATIAVEVAQHYVMLCRELIMEEIRVTEFLSQPPSRQRCLYVCESLDEAACWRPLVGTESVICELRCTGVIHRADSNLLLADSEPLSVTRDRARRYWRGESGDNAQWETLFTGDVEVVAVGL